MTQYTKVIRDGEVAVLYSPGFGAGWSTWNNEHAEFLLFDEQLVAMVERQAAVEEVDEFLANTGLTDVYTGGWRDIEIEWLPVGTEFYIHEYDGSETVHTKESDNWRTA